MVWRWLDKLLGMGRGTSWGKLTEPPFEKDER